MSLTLVALLIFCKIQYCTSQNFVCCDGAVRLSGGNVSNEGQVEVCISGQWKTVCDNNWSENEARVVCRQLGYTTQDALPLIRATFGTGTGMIVEQVRCSGTERRLTDCTVRDIVDGECNHNEDAGVRCTCRNGDLRLQGSATLGQGRVEVCINNVWGTVCDDSWNSTDANVVCSQLGFSRFGARSFCCATYGQGSGPIQMTNVECRGNELSLTDCLYTSNHNCSHEDDASIQCQTRISCHDGDVRLVNGSQPYEGRVEICFNEIWGTICGYIYPEYWNISEANVVCQQLGFSGAKKSSFGFGSGSLPVHIAYVYCRGYESNIGECTYSTKGVSFCVGFGRHIIGVQCISEAIKNGQLRLANGPHKYAGRVEMYWNSEWRTVCHDGWDEHDAQVVCRQLNYLSTSVHVQATSYEEYHFKTKRNPVLLTDVGCSALENNLTVCCASEISYCHNGAYAGVRCAQCAENSIQLYGELSQSEGFVLICHGGFWGKIVYGSTAAAKVICRQLGFSKENATSYYYFMQNSGLPYLLNWIACTSNESQLSQCSYYTHNNNYRSKRKLIGGTFAVKCQITSQTVPGAPRSVQISKITSSTITLTWSPPLISERHGLTIYGYTAICSMDHSLSRNAANYTERFNATLFNLHSFTAYNCCVAADSNHGMGKFACQNTFTWNLYAVPTRIKSLLLNSSSLLLSWHSPDALYTLNVIHVVEEYHVEVVDSSAGDQHIYTTEETYLLISNLKPNRQYTFRVAAFAGERGQFSQPLTVKTLKEMDVQSSSRKLTLLLASFLGLVSFTLLITIIVVSIYISYRLWKSEKRLQVEVPVYEMVDMPRSNHDDSSIDIKLEYHPNKPENDDTDLHILKHDQAKDFPHLPHKNLTSTFTEFVQRAGPGQAAATETNKENTYQPLIPPRFRALDDDKSEYQSLMQNQSTLPSKFTISPMAMGSAPPAIPPKPKAI